MHRLRQRLNQVKERTMKKSLMLSFKQSTWTPSKLWLKTGLHEKVGAGGSKALEPFPAPAEPGAALAPRVSDGARLGCTFLGGFPRPAIKHAAGLGWWRRARSGDLGMGEAPERKVQRCWGALAAARPHVSLHRGARHSRHCRAGSPLLPLR